MRVISAASLLALAPAVLGRSVTLYPADDCGEKTSDAFQYVSHPRATLRDRVEADRGSRWWLMGMKPRCTASDPVIEYTTSRRPLDVEHRDFGILTWAPTQASQAVNYTGLILPQALEEVDESRDADEREGRFGQLLTCIHSQVSGVARLEVAGIMVVEFVGIACLVELLD